jgi:hypothetical protein
MIDPFTIRLKFYSQKHLYELEEQECLNTEITLMLAAATRFSISIDI